jgi:hypothetical protein
VWALLVWGVLTLALGVVVGEAIRTAERREIDRDRRAVEATPTAAPQERPHAS